MESPVSIQSLKSDIAKLQQQVAGLSATVKNQTAPVNPSSKDKVNQLNVSTSQIMDALWNSVFYYVVYWDDVADGWSLGADGTGTGTATAAGVFLQTDSTSGHRVYFQKGPSYNSVLSFDKYSRFRTSYSPGKISNVYIVASIGDATHGTVTPHYGFRQENATLYGVTANGTSETTFPLVTVAANGVYVLEARLTPGKRVDFYVSDSNAIATKYRGSISTTLPTGNIGLNSLEWIQYKITTNTSATASVGFSFAEYIQSRL